MLGQIKKLIFKILSILIVLLLSLVTTFSTALAEGNVSWEENNGDIAIYTTEFKDLYNISYLNTVTRIEEDTYEKNVMNGIRLLMVNGGFVPDPGTLLYDDNVVYISANRLADVIGVKIQTYNDDYGISISMKNDSSSLTMKEYGYIADLNGEKIEMQDCLEYINGEVYVPLRFVVEKFGGKVEYIHDYINSICHDEVYEDAPDINMIVVEMPSNHEKTYTVEEGLSIIKGMSVEEHDNVVEYMKEINESFGEEPDYDPLSIKYVGYDIGRYYVYELEGYETLPIFFNKYTGEVYSNKPGLPFVNISKGFINISWLFQ